MSRLSRSHFGSSHFGSSHFGSRSQIWLLFFALHSRWFACAKQAGLPLLQSIPCSFCQVFLFHGFLTLPWLHDRFRSSSIESSGFPRPPDSMAVLCCRRVGPPHEFEKLSDRRVEWFSFHRATSDRWSPQWICARCSRSAGLEDIPSRNISHCPQCSGSNLTFVLDCSSNVHWTWCSRCQQRGVEVLQSPLPVPQSVGVRLVFPRPPLTNGASLRMWKFCHFSSWWWAIEPCLVFQIHVWLEVVHRTLQLPLLLRPPLRALVDQLIDLCRGN